MSFSERKQWSIRHRGDLNLRQINSTLNMGRPETVKSRREPFLERTSPMRDDTTRVRENWSKRFVKRRVWKRREYLIVLAWNQKKKKTYKKHKIVFHNVISVACCSLKSGERSCIYLVKFCILYFWNFVFFVLISEIKMCLSFKFSGTKVA